MKQFKKLLSLLLAIVMIVSSLSVLASAYGVEWRDSAIISQYNSIDKPKLTTEQYATAALDEVDRMLAEDGDALEIYIATFDYTSLNAALDSIKTITTGSVWTSFKGLLGGLANLDFSAINGNGQGLKRVDGGGDLDLIKAVLTFLTCDQNRGLIKSFLKNELDLGTLLPSFVPEVSDLNVTTLLKELLYEATYNEDVPDSGIPAAKNSVDVMVQDLIDALLVTGYDGDEPLLPVVEGITTIDGSDGRKMLDFIDDALKVLYNEYLVPRANDLWINDLNELLADNAEEIEKYKSYFNLKADGTVNFEFAPFGFDNTKLVLEQLNDILGSIINLALADDIGFEWESGDNSMIVTNIINIGKQVLAVTGEDFFEPFVEIKTAEELEAMTDQEVVAYVARTILNSSIDGVWIPDTADSIVKVGSYLVKDLMAVELPEKDYQSESAYPVDDINTVYTILSDFGIKALNENPGLDLNYGIGLDALATAAANWAIDEYGGLLSGVKLSTNNTGWKNLDTLLFSIVNRNWFDASLFDGAAVTAENVIKGIINKVVDLDFDGLIALLCNKSSSSEFNNCSPKQFIINLATRIVNVVFPGSISTNLTSLEGIIEKNNLADTAYNLLGVFGNQQFQPKILKCVLPIVTDALDLTKEAEFDKPEFNIESSYAIVSGSATVAFEVYNPSSGVNTGYTDPVTGVFHQDNLFNIELVEMTIAKTNAAGASQGTQNVTLPANKIVKNGQRLPISVAVKTTAALDADITIKYNILKEDGQPLTSTPLEAHAYTAIVSSADDSEATVAVTKNGFTVTGPKNIYITNLKDLNKISFKIKAGSGVANSTITGGSFATTSTLYKTGFIALNDQQVIAFGNKGTTLYSPISIQNYDSDNEDNVNAVYTTKGYNKYTQNIGVKIAGTAAEVSSNIIIYKDYGLYSLFEREVNAQRQSYDYDAAAFNDYIVSMRKAASICATAKVNTTFTLTTNMGKASKFESYAADLEAKIEALEATKTGGVEALRARITEIEETPGFASRNYMTYTWSNFRDKYKDADKLASKYEEGGSNYGLSPSGLDVTYTLWELNNYYNRLRPVDPSKVNLALEIAEEPTRGFVEEEYTAESWARLVDAIAAAEAVNADAGAFQNEINDAYVELVEAQKRLVPVETEEPAGEWAVAAVSPVDPAYAPKLITNSAGENLLLGVAPTTSGIAIEEYFDLPAGYTVDCAAIGTGKTATIKDASGNAVGTVVLVIKGDLDGDGEVTSLDASSLDRASLGIIALSAAGDGAADYAADIDGSGDATSLDASSVSRASLGLIAIDYANV